MSIIIGVVSQNKVIVAADTQKTDMLTFEKSIDVAKKLTTFGLDDTEYIVAFGGMQYPINVLYNALAEKNNWLEDKNLSVTCAQIYDEFERLQLRGVTMLIGGFENGTAQLTVISADGMFTTEEKIILTPPSINGSNEIFSGLDLNASENDVLEQLRALVVKCSDIDNGQTINKDFYYGILRSSNEIEIQEKSDFEKASSD